VDTSGPFSHAGTLPQVRELPIRRVPIRRAPMLRAAAAAVTTVTCWPAAADFRVTSASAVAGEPRWPRACLEEHWTLVGPEYFLG
jgi:hypothetical protein